MDDFSRLPGKPSSNLSILVVGAGLGGLAFAIDAHLKGNDVRVIERRHELDSGGSILGISNGVSSHFKKWPGFMELVGHDAVDPKARIMKYDLTRLADVPLAHPVYPAFPITRPSLQKALKKTAEDLGISIEWETAELVVAADGIHSKSWRVIHGDKPEDIDSSYSCQLVSFSSGLALQNPVIKDGFGDFENGVMFTLGPLAHMGITRSAETITWTLVHKTCKEHLDIHGTYSAHGNETALSVLSNWAPFYREIVKAAPSEAILPWKLTWRDPHPQWVSPLGRIVQLGDSAHPFIPTSGAGGTMAIEDAYSLATCLKLAGKDNLSLALKVHNLLRYERVSCAQKNAFRNSEKFHYTNWEVAEKDPSSVAEFGADWLHSHQVEEYTTRNFSKAADHILTGSMFKNTNIPKGYTYKPWKIREVLSALERRELINDKGDW